ncbi:hypothetical protein NP493_99g01030 [Ridgeia piscesae]|uniref:Uncharacterized protein n=1 Tax=Ridgeia piscesae TaxID=27915 RepID=A0AAD9P7N3_RIDPI|nr:hypothetical protein NP493_99g01030 [Ridgeia piscesae]
MMFCTVVATLLCLWTGSVTCAGLSGTPFKCGGHLCDGRTEYCDSQVDMCTSCELPCSQTTSDNKRCKQLCPGYSTVRSPPATTAVAAERPILPSDSQPPTAVVIIRE